MRFACSAILLAALALFWLGGQKVHGKGRFSQCISNAILQCICGHWAVEDCFEHDVNYVRAGFGIASLPGVQSPEECQVLCVGHVECYSFGYNVRVRRCVLKRDPVALGARRKAAPNVISGPVNCDGEKGEIYTGIFGEPTY